MLRRNVMLRKLQGEGKTGRAALLPRQRIPAKSDDKGNERLTGAGSGRQDVCRRLTDEAVIERGCPSGSRAALLSTCPRFFPALQPGHGSTRNEVPRKGSGGDLPFRAVPAAFFIYIHSKTTTNRKGTKQWQLSI